MASKFDLAFEELDKEFGASREMRKQAIELLQRQLAFAEIREGDKPMMIQSRLAIVKTLDDLIKSNTDLSLQKVKMQLARREGESNGMIGDAVVELLKLARADRKDVRKDENPQPIGDLKKIDAELSQKAAELDLQISEGEMEACGTAPTSDSDNPVVLDDKPEEDEE